MIELPGNIYVNRATNPKPLTSLLLQRKREPGGLSLAPAAERLGASSRNACARYEQGRAAPSIEKLGELLHAHLAPISAVCGL
ncbi:MAG TPA: XRE family transcriptional regulator [Chloroflexi bacterium]|nr:XRE family transcriptional regulator [Chloroflexota bacterium]